MIGEQGKQASFRLALSVLQHHVCRLRREHQQVFRAQIVAVAVAVVHHLALCEWPAQQTFGFEAVNVLQLPSLGMPATWVPALLCLTADHSPGDDSRKLRTVSRPCGAEEGCGGVAQAFHDFWYIQAVSCPPLIVRLNQRPAVSLGTMVLQFYAAECLVGFSRDRLNWRMALKGFLGDPRHRYLDDLKRDIAGHFSIGHQRIKVVL